MSKKPNPGSVEASEQGCTCPVLDNAHGKGRYGNGEKYGWWMTEGCPLHGVASVPNVIGGEK